tara:strand:- start:28 stop:591 length:564 start_codon:yes stop_codon:yes gene_type:complete
VTHLELGWDITSLGSTLIPPHRFSLILHNAAMPGGIHTRKVEFRLGMTKPLPFGRPTQPPQYINITLLGCQPIPPCRFCDILRHTTPGEIPLREGNPRWNETLLGRHPIPAYRFGHVQRDATSRKIHFSESNLRVKVARAWSISRYLEPPQHFGAALLGGTAIPPYRFAHIRRHTTPVEIPTRKGGQ